MTSLDRRKFISKTTGAIVSSSIAPLRLFSIGTAKGTYSDNINRLKEWVIESYVPNRDVRLVACLPSGKIYNGKERDDLKHLCWLQNCNLFAIYALREFEPCVAKSLEKSYLNWYSKEFPDIEERTENYLPLAKLPAASPPDGKFYRTILHKTKCSEYTIGTETYSSNNLGNIISDDPRGLLKFGALGAHLRNERRLAEAYFQKALALWDGVGFQTPRRSQHDAYYTRYLAYALIVEKALHFQIPAHKRNEIERRLWSMQDKNGGLWTNYNRDGTVPPFAKQTTEIGPLTLLAYCDQIWE